MRCLPILMLGVTLSATAQQEPAPTSFPADAVALTPTALREKLVDRTFVVKPRSDPELRVQYRGDYAYINIGNMSDSGKWRTEGSSVCYEWRNIRHSCSEVRQVGDALYIKRSNNGEIVPMTIKP